MSTCKECLHHGVCEDRDKLMLTVNNIFELMYQHGVEHSCVHFKSTADVVPRAEFDALRGRLAEEEQIRESLEGFIRHELEKEKKKAVVETLHELERRTEQLADELKYEEIKLEPCTCGKLPKLKIMHNIMMGHGSFDDLILYECPKCGKQADGAAGTELKSRIRAKNNWNNMLLAEAPKGGAE